MALEVLHLVNKFRQAIGLAPKMDLEKGIREDGHNCPIYNSLNHETSVAFVDNVAIIFEKESDAVAAASKWGVPYYRGINAFREHSEKANDYYCELTHENYFYIPTPRAMSDFIKAFDEGNDYQRYEMKFDEDGEPLEVYVA